MIAHVRQLTVLSKRDRPTLNDTAHTQQLVMGETQARGVELMVVAAARPSVTMIPHPLRPQKSAQRERWTMTRDGVALGATTIKKGTRPLFLNKRTHKLPSSLAVTGNEILAVKTIYGSLRQSTTPIPLPRRRPSTTF